MNKMSQFLRPSRWLGAVAALSLTLALVPGRAEAVVITPGASSGEPGLYQLMNSLYGAGNWTQWDSGGVSTFSTANRTFYQSYDVRYASDNAEVGFLKDNTTFFSTMSVTGSGSGAVATPASATITSDMLSTGGNGIASYGLKNTTTGQLYSSDWTKNADGLVHLIMFTITNMPNTFVMAWEDTLGGGDHDYNDMIVQLVQREGSVPVPEPATLSVIGMALIGMAAIRRRRPRH
jgi:hypothetical protein